MALVAASVTILVGSLLALGQDNLKARLAFSTVSQLSYIILGAALLESRRRDGRHRPYHEPRRIEDHAVPLRGSIYVSAHKTEISQMSGLAKRMPWTMAAFALASLSVVGIPGTSGCISKWFLALGSADSESFAVLAVLLLSSLLSAAYLGPIVYKAYFETDPRPTRKSAKCRGWSRLGDQRRRKPAAGPVSDPVLKLAGRVADSLFQTGSAMP